MELNEIFQNSDCLIYRVVNFYDVEEIEDWIVEKTKYQLIPESNEDLYDAYFVVKGFLLHGINKIEECYIDLCIPERISEFVFRNRNNIFTVENAIESNLKAIPAVASERFGDYELYYCPENPETGINVLKTGLALSMNKYAVAQDLGYIFRDENRIEEAIEMFKISVEYDPSSEYTYLELADLYSQLNLKEEELKYRRKFKEAGGIE
jgi:tetratricopeptide (TPR) repeat protein